MTTSQDSSISEVSSEQIWRESLTSEIKATEERFYRNKTRWNFWYYFGIYGSITLPAISALVLKSEVISNVATRNDMAAFVATLAAITATAMATGNFQKRWMVSRTAETELHTLKVDILKPNSNLEDISCRLKSSLEKYNDGVIREAP